MDWFIYRVYIYLKKIVNYYICMYLYPFYISSSYMSENIIQLQKIELFSAIHDIFLVSKLTNDDFKVSQRVAPKETN